MVSCILLLLLAVHVCSKCMLEGSQIAYYFTSRARTLGEGRQIAYYLGSYVGRRTADCLLFRLVRWVKDGRLPIISRAGLVRWAKDGRLPIISRAGLVRWVKDGRLPII